MKINKYKKISANKYRIYFDDCDLVIYEDVILKYNLLYKKEIDNLLLSKINEDNYKASIYDSALKYISIRMRFESEIVSYLKKKKYDLKDIDEAINKLKNENLINDVLTAKSFISDKLNLTSMGPNKIKNELSINGISNEIINDLFLNVDNNLIKNKLEKVIDKELKLNTKLPKNKIMNKIITRCINMGYDKDIIIEILNTKEILSISNIKNDYDLLYRKYEDKYDKYKLESVLKNKLFQKGYSFDEINKLF